MQQYLKAILWPRTPAEGKGATKSYRYVIVGMLVTDEPIAELEGENELVADGPVFCLAEVLREVRKRKAARRVGDANDVLLSLDEV